MKLIGVALMVAGCGSGESETKPAPAPAPIAKTAKPPADAAPPIDAPPRFALPAAPGIKAPEILGKAQRDVEKILGKGEKMSTPGWFHYQATGQPFIRVVYDRGRAVGIEAPHVRFPSDYTLSEDDIEAIADWFGAVKGDGFTYGESFLGDSIAGYDVKWIEGQESKVKASVKAQQKKRRVDFAKNVQSIMRTMGAGGMRAVAEGDNGEDLVFHGDPECDEAGLLEAWKGVRDFNDWAPADFATMKCAGKDGATIHVR